MFVVLESIGWFADKEKKVKMTLLAGKTFKDLESLKMPPDVQKRFKFVEMKEPEKSVMSKQR